MLAGARTRAHAGNTTAAAALLAALTGASPEEVCGRGTGVWGWLLGWWPRGSGVQLGGGPYAYPYAYWNKTHALA